MVNSNECSRISIKLIPLYEYVFKHLFKTNQIFSKCHYGKNHVKIAKNLTGRKSPISKSDDTR